MFCGSNDTRINHLDEYSVDFLLCGWKCGHNLRVDNE